MVFSSQLFLFYFLPVVLVGYYCLPRALRHLFLTALSYLFYGWANPLFVVLMFASTLIDYVCGWRISTLPDRHRGRKLALLISLVSNLSLLGFFKYFNFAVGSYNDLLSMLGLGGLQLQHVLRVTLPLGISFYTFQSMSYTIDIYRKDARAIRNPIDFACYVSMFPQLVAGPIIRFQSVADQLKERTHTLEKFSRGSAFLCLGLAKKVLLANPCGFVADTVFDAAATTTLDAWLGTVAYAFQIYFDFSGYSDMAIGLGLMLGFEFMKNFDSPYLSDSITDFWRRWHISLSTWLRDYLYIPLGGNRKGAARTYANLALVMLLGGLWHGAAWNFVIWGGIHGAMLAGERAMGKDSPYRRLPRAMRVGITFAIVCVAWVFFRCDTLPEALSHCATMLGLGDASASASLINGMIRQPYYMVTLALAAAVTWRGNQSWDFAHAPGIWQLPVCLVLFLLAALMLMTQSYNPFIYFIF
jgi:alginate O-acetyltransferase complex protein AlgI